MAEKLDPKETVTLEELLMSNVYTQEALEKSQALYFHYHKKKKEGGRPKL